MAQLLAERRRVDRGFERLYRRHVADVYRYALAVLRNPADAEDVTQTTFLNALRAYERGERPKAEQNWLIAIAHNVCRQRFRQSQRRPREVSLDEDVADRIVDDDGPTGEDIRRALGQLAFNQRAALVMRELEGRSYAEIGEILELSTSAVETLIFRARRALREQLETSLTCGEAEGALSKRLDGSLAAPERRALRAHLRECRECAALERKQRAQRAALKRLGVVQLPPSLAGFFGGGGAGTVGTIVAGTGVAAKAAAIVAAGVVAGGVGHEAVEAVAASEPARTPLPALRRVPQTFPKLYGSTALAFAPRGALQTVADSAALPGAAPSTGRLRGAVQRALARPGSGAPASGEASREESGGSHGAAGPGGGVTPEAPSPPPPVPGVVDQATC